MVMRKALLSATGMAGMRTFAGGSWFAICMQNGKKATFGLLEECQQLAAAAATSSPGGSSSSSSSRLLVGLHEGVEQVTPLGPGAGVEVTTSSRR